MYPTSPFPYVLETLENDDTTALRPGVTVRLVRERVALTSGGQHPGLAKLDIGVAEQHAVHPATYGHVAVTWIEGMIGTSHYKHIGMKKHLLPKRTDFAR